MGHEPPEVKDAATIAGEQWLGREAPKVDEIVCDECWDRPCACTGPVEWWATS